MSVPHFFKAKAIRRDNGQWVSGYFVGYNNTIVTTTHNGKVVPYVSSFVSYFVYPETVCYFSGLLDKNAREIYSRDLFQYTAHPGLVYPSFKGQIGYNIHYASFLFMEHLWTTNSDTLVSHPVFFSEFDEIKEDFLSHMEVTGNIYDNYKSTTLENNE